MSAEFVYRSNPANVIFGCGTVSRVAAEMEALGASKALILSTSVQSELGSAIGRQLKDRVAGLFSGAVMHTPVEVTEEALGLLTNLGVDCLISAGGGSTIGLGKALAFRTDLPQIVVPTTYAGSEMTPILGQTENGVKTTLRSPKVLPETVIYDVELTLSLPVALSVTSGINAMAHAVEALYAKDTNPIVSQISIKGIQNLYEALPAITENPEDLRARKVALEGAWLCGSALGLVGMALHHKLCHVLGGSFELPHAETHTVMLPHTTAFNALLVPELDKLGKELAQTTLARAIFDLASRCGAPTKLSQIGMKEDSLQEAAQIAVNQPYFNPRPFDEDQILTLLKSAYFGERPS